ncbi:DUF1298 domain-containing protein [Nocardia cyriacigeorgica]|uniref:diacylglycerol O-acyltransferase n=1 Tax=Nocardia cyriacigeorgica TaxID=135487 RepID=A0A6P1CYT6_9NOCA|nr:DUF1298 domain-containing protein [Nocardia cyriacigeorgica]NEW43286.1 DUF1298 domain-containing protein [Nocardia cyriacigeorgica]NEW48919.1 DUF1298 domain-containing protein [Nocardia cyriacigeorgica]
MAHLSQTDYLTWRLQRNPVLRPTIVSILMLDEEPDWAKLTRAVDRCTRAVPELRQRLVPSLLPLAPPRWKPDEYFDLSWHLQRSPLIPRIDLEAVLDFARHDAMNQFEPDRPLWRATLLHGQDGQGCALVFKVHHSLTDGVSGVRILAGLCDLDRVGVGHIHSETPPSQHRVVFHYWSEGLGLLRHGISRSAATAVGAVTHPVATVRDGIGLAASLARVVRPITTTLSPVMTDRGTARRLAAFDVPTAALARAAHTNECTMNEAFITAVLLGLRDYHDRHGTSIEQLRVTMPISLRTDDDPLGGNRITLSRFVVPVNGDPAVLMRRVGEVIRSQRSEPALPYSAAVAAVLNRVPVTLIAGMLEHVDFVASDVPGSPVPLYLAGARIEQMYAFSPTLGTALNVTMASHAGTCFLGINADIAAVPDVRTLSQCLADGFRAVLDLDDQQATGI